MAEIKNLADAQKALAKFYGKQAAGPYTLDRMRRLMEYLGNPQNELRVIHVAGTSGKTSTAYYITSLLAAAGYKAGLTVSPHVDNINERVQINCAPLEETRFCIEIDIFLKLVKKSGISPSYFECMVAFAYWEFARQKVDYAVVEVGLGGLLDGTNVVERDDKVCVITDIGLDHTELLGETVDKIAAQKAGIIQDNNHVFMYRQSDEVTEAVAKRVNEKHALLHLVPDESANAPNSGLPKFQQRNLWLAAYIDFYILGRDYRKELTTEQINEAATVYIPARMEVQRYGEKTLVIDGAHNAQKLGTLLEAVHEKFPGKQLAALVGFVEGDPRRLHGALDVLTQNCEALITTNFYEEKDYPKHSVPTDQVIIQCHELGFDDISAVESPKKALQQLMTRKEEILLITGSFYLLNHIRPLLKGQV
jgi:dihydrofolate synthase/folylpolyglutamate synthase